MKDFTDNTYSTNYSYIFTQNFLIICWLLLIYFSYCKFKKLFLNYFLRENYAAKKTYTIKLLIIAILCNNYHSRLTFYINCVGLLWVCIISHICVCIIRQDIQIHMYNIQFYNIYTYTIHLSFTFCLFSLASLLPLSISLASLLPLYLTCHLYKYIL